MLSGEYISNPRSICIYKGTSSRAGTSSLETRETPFLSYDARLYEEVFNNWISGLISALDSIVLSAKVSSMRAHPPDGTIVVNALLSSGRITNITLKPILKEIIDDLKKIKEPKIENLLNLLRARGLIEDFDCRVEEDTITLSFTIPRALNMSVESKSAITRALSNPVYLIVLSSTAIFYKRYAVILDCSILNQRHHMKIRLL